VLAGEHISAIVRDLNGRNILTSAGNNWNRTTLRRMLCSARISGRREHIPRNSYETVRPLIGEIVWAPKDDPEIVWKPQDEPDNELDHDEPASGTDEDEPELLRWPAIISMKDSDGLRALLTRPDRRLTTGGARKHLLSGILHCARCGHPMVGRSSRGVLRYVCNKNPDGGKAACGGTFVTAAPTDDHIRDLVLIALDSPELVARLRHRDDAAPDDLHARIRADEDELEALAADHGNGEISRVEWKAARSPIVARLEAARARLAASTQTSALEGFVGSLEDMTARWENCNSNTSQRRAVVTAVLEKVMVLPATVMGRNRFDSDRLDPVWRVT
jgi:hypothetical protein